MHSFLVCLYSFSGIILRSIHGAVCINSLFLFYYQMVFHCKDIPQFCYLLTVDGHWGCFEFVATKNKAAINIPLNVFVWTYAFISLE